MFARSCSFPIFHTHTHTQPNCENAFPWNNVTENRENALVLHWHTAYCIWCPCWRSFVLEFSSVLACAHAFLLALLLIMITWARMYVCVNGKISLQLVVAATVAAPPLPPPSPRVSTNRSDNKGCWPCCVYQRALLCTYWWALGSHHTKPDRDAESNEGVAPTRARTRHKPRKIESKREMTKRNQRIEGRKSDEKERWFFCQIARELRRYTDQLST